MVNKIISFFNKEMNGLHQAAFLLGSFALLSQILALVRDKLLAHTFGAGPVLDLYYAAFRVPDFLFITIGSLVSVSVLIPFLIHKEEKNKKDIKHFIDSVFSFFLLLLTVAGLIVFFLLPLILPKLFPGIVGSEQETLLLITRILLLSPLFLGISNLFGSLTQSHNKFFVYALSPLLYNIGIIVGVVFLFPAYGLVGLVSGVIFGALLHMLVQVPVIFGIGLIPKITFKPDIKAVWKVAKLSFPRTITLSIGHISIFFLIAFASLLYGGSISVFNFAFNLQSVPLSIIGVSYSLAAFPTLSRLYSEGDMQNFLEKLVSSARHIVFWSIPFSVLFIVLRAHIVRIILGSGEFNWSDTRLTAAVLALFSVSLVFQSLVLLFIRGLYAMGLTKKPLYANVVSAIVTVSSAFIFMKLFAAFPSFRLFFEVLFKIPDIAGSGVLMLALGFTLGSITNGIILWAIFARSLKGVVNPILRTFLETFGASVIMGFVIFVTLRIFDNIFSLETFWGLFMQAFLSAFCGIAVAIFVLYLLRNQELKEIKETLHQRFWKAKVVSPDTQIV